MNHNAGHQLQFSGGSTWNVVGSDIIFYGDHVLRIESCPVDLIRCLPLLQKGATRSELCACAVDKEAFEDALNLLCDLRFVVPAVDKQWLNSNVERQVLWFSARGIDGNSAQQRLSTSHVAILGLGGIGSVVLELLSGAGIRKFTLIDHDHVSLHNLNRQPIYSLEDMGRLKVGAAVKWLLARDRECSVSVHPVMIQDVTVLEQIRGDNVWDCLVVAADHPVGRIDEIAETFCEQSGVPVLGGACGLHIGTWGPLLLKSTVSAWKQFRVQAAKATPESVPAPFSVMRASFGPTNSFVASQIAHDVLLMIAGEDVPSTAAQMIVDFRTLIVTPLWIVSPSRQRDA